MEQQMEYFNTQEVASILGVNVSTVKRWTDEGKLTCIRTAGGHRRFRLEDLARFLEANERQRRRAHLFPIEDRTDLELSRHILRGDFAFLQRFLMERALEVNRPRIHQVLSGLYLAQYALPVIYDELLTPVLHRIGDLWEEGIISVGEEHLATQALRDGVIRLQGQIRIPRRKIGTALCLNPAGELHDLPLKLVDHILEWRGFHVLYSGQLTPADEVERMFTIWHPNRLYISSTYVPEPEKTQKELDRLFELARNHHTLVYVGGRGFDHLRYDHPAVVQRLRNFQEVAST